MVETIKTLLINPPVAVSALYGKFSSGGSDQPPLSLCYIASYLLKYKKDVRILDSAKLGLDTSGILQAISDYAPDIVGFHTCTPYFKTVKFLASQIKQRWPDILTMAGGPHFWADTVEDIENSALDVICVGEGEAVCLEIVESLERHGLKGFSMEAAPDIKGIVYKKEGRGVKNPSRELIRDIDTIPRPARCLLPPLHRYMLSIANYKHTPATGMITSRGCPFRCIFCVNSVRQERVRLHSVDYVTEEVDELIDKFGIRDICFLDDVLTVSKNRTLQICDKLAERRDKVIWSCNIKVGLVDRQILKAMKASGCWMVMVGIESGNQEILDRIKKKFKLEQAEELCRWCREAGLMFHPNFIIGHPGETEETINQTIDFARKLYAHYLMFTLMVPYPGTVLWNTAEQYGELRKDDFDRYNFGEDVPCFIPRGLTADILVRKKREAFLKCYLNLPMVMRHLRCLKSVNDIKRAFQAVKILTRL